MRNRRNAKKILIVFFFFLTTISYYGNNKRDKCSTCTDRYGRQEAKEKLNLQWQRKRCKNFKEHSSAYTSNIIINLLYDRCTNVTHFFFFKRFNYFYGIFRAATMDVFFFFFLLTFASLRVSIVGLEPLTVFGIIRYSRERHQGNNNAYFQKRSEFSGFRKKRICTTDGHPSSIVSFIRKKKIIFRRTT